MKVQKRSLTIFLGLMTASAWGQVDSSLPPVNSNLPPVNSKAPVPFLGKGYQKRLPDDKTTLPPLLDDRRTYQLGSVWGKLPVNEDDLPAQTAGFQRMAKATAKVGGGTGFVLGEFEGEIVMATNHHVLETASDCDAAPIVFPLLDTRVRCKKFLGSWSDVDLTLFTVTMIKPKQRAELLAVAQNFSFKRKLSPEMPLLTIGFGIADNPQRKMVANQDDDCKVFSGQEDFRFMADPDELNPGPYKAWSFALGCEVSHGDSGSAMAARDNGEVVGIIWTGRIPKSPLVQDSDYLKELLMSRGDNIWKELSYAVPAVKIHEVLSKVFAGSNTAEGKIVKAVLAN